MDLTGEVTGKHLLIVEDIIDSGFTPELVKNYQHLKQVPVDACVLLRERRRKRERREAYALSASERRGHSSRTSWAMRLKWELSGAQL